MSGKRRRSLRVDPVRTLPLSAYCPRLTADNHDIKSKVTFRYNCIAWAAGCAKMKWGDVPPYFWPEGVERGPGIQSLVRLFASLGYVACDNGTVERGFEKVALYASDDEWVHAARQVKGGRWTSKMGDFEDIVHDSPESVAGDAYGQVAVYMKREKKRATRRKS